MRRIAVAHLMAREEEEELVGGLNGGGGGIGGWVASGAGGRRGANAAIFGAAEQCGSVCLCFWCCRCPGGMAGGRQAEPHAAVEGQEAGRRQQNGWPNGALAPPPVARHRWVVMKNETSLEKREMRAVNGAIRPAARCAVSAELHI